MKTVEIVLAVVRSVAKEHGGGGDIGVDTNLVLEGDLDSLATLEILEALEKRFQVEVFSRLNLAEVNTPAKLAEWIDANR